MVKVTLVAFPSINRPHTALPNQVIDYTAFAELGAESLKKRSKIIFCHFRPILT